MTSSPRDTTPSQGEKKLELNTPGLVLPPMPALPAAQVLRSLTNYGGAAAT